MIDVTFEGIEEVSAALDRWEVESIDALAKAIDMSKEDLLAKSMALAPKLEGDLEGSGTTDPASGVNINESAKEISAEIGFHTPYAARRHEEVYNPGPITSGKPPVDGMTPGRKYIEQPLLRYMQKYIKDWADAIRRITGSG